MHTNSCLMDDSIPKVGKNDPLATLLQLTKTTPFFPFENNLKIICIVRVIPHKSRFVGMKTNFQNIWQIYIY